MPFPPTVLLLTAALLALGGAHARAGDTPEPTAPMPTTPPSPAAKAPASSTSAPSPSAPSLSAPGTAAVPTDRPARPPLDLAAPKTVATATFALG